MNNIKKEGYYRNVPTSEEQLQDLIKYKIIYCNHDSYMKWIKDENIKLIESYDEFLSELPDEMIPLRICGIKGNEFEEYKERREIKLSPNMVKIIDGEEQEILLGIQEGEGSEILFS